MRLNVDIGNPETEEWERSFQINLEPYPVIFKRKHHIDFIPEGLENDLGLDNHPIKLRDDDTVNLIAHYHHQKNSMMLCVAYQTKTLCQVIGTAIDSESNGLSLIVVLPDRTYPINITCIK